jgi:hypothetical protein
MRCEACGCDCAERDAEVERLKLAVHHEKQYAADLITTLRCEAEDKDTEMERLLTKSEADKNTLLVSLKVATKEIERLKSESAINESAIRDLCSIARDKDKLITELADAIRNGSVIYPYTIAQRTELLKSALEATKQ